MLLQNLTGTDAVWELRPLDHFQQGVYADDEAPWVAATVPGHWQQSQGLSTYAGNALYRHLFRASPTPPGERRWLIFHGNFYQSRAYLNGIDLGAHEGYFVPYVREVTDLLRDENRLLIEVACPEEHNKVGKRMITGVFSHWDCLDPVANPGGIWLPVELHRSGPVRLEQALLRTEQTGADAATLHYRLHLDSITSAPLQVVWRFTPRTFLGEAQEFRVSHASGLGQRDVAGTLRLDQPRLWWSHDLGAPDRYDVCVQVFVGEDLSDEQQFTFGVRTFELRNWIPYLNGERLLAKGSNYAPGDQYLATMTLDRCRADLQLARDAHMNMLRVHAHVDHPALYEAADELGVMLWQDFPLQWLYDRSVVPQAERQVRAMVHLLHNHPSIVIWCMHNEPVFLADTHDERLITRLRTYASAFGFSWNRDVLDRRLQRVAAAEDPKRPVVPSSGEFHLPFIREGTDVHAYFGWYDSYGSLEQAEKLLPRMRHNLRFVTEFGAQSFPNLESARKFIPEDLSQANTDYLAQRHGFQHEIMSKFVPWREAGSLAEAVRLSQDYQIFINRYYIDRLRQHKYRPTGGIIPFMFIDPWPAVLWSIVDYWRIPKRSYAAMRMAFAPQYAFCLVAPHVFRVNEAIDLPLFAVNDGRQAVSLVLRAMLRDPSNGLLADLRHAIALPADSLAEEIDRLRLMPTTSGTYHLTVCLEGGSEPVEHTYEIVVI